MLGVCAQHELTGANWSQTAIISKVFQKLENVLFIVVVHLIYEELFQIIQQQTFLWHIVDGKEAASLFEIYVVCFLVHRFHESFKLTGTQIPSALRVELVENVNDGLLKSNRQSFVLNGLEPPRQSVLADFFREQFDIGTAICGPGNFAASCTRQN